MVVPGVGVESSSWNGEVKVEAGVEKAGGPGGDGTQPTAAVRRTVVVGVVGSSVAMLRMAVKQPVVAPASKETVRLAVVPAGMGAGLAAREKLLAAGPLRVVEWMVRGRSGPWLAMGISTTMVPGSDSKTPKSCELGAETTGVGSTMGVPMKRTSPRPTRSPPPTPGAPKWLSVMVRRTASARTVVAKVWTVLFSAERPWSNSWGVCQVWPASVENSVVKDFASLLWGWPKW